MIQLKWCFLLAVLLVFNACKEEVTNPEEGMNLTDIPYSPTAYTVVSPKGFPAMEIPVDNPMTEQGIELGRHLFYDPILSRDSSISCASCHQLKKAFTDGRAKALGIDGRQGTRGSMSLINIGYAQLSVMEHNFMWDGRFKTLEEQALEPIEAFAEMDNTWDEVIRRLKAHPTYPKLFREAFGIENTTEISKEMAAKAIAQFERTLNSADSDYDKDLNGEKGLSSDAFDGREMFMGDAAGGVNPFAKDAECAHCHGTTAGRQTFTSGEFSNNGLQRATTYSDFKDAGLGGVTGIKADTGLMKQVTLRNIMLTAPYMHDGRFQTIDEVLDFYISGGQFSTGKDRVLTTSTDLHKFTAADKDKLKAFLESLTDTSYFNNEAWKSPF